MDPVVQALIDEIKHLAVDRHRLELVIAGLNYEINGLKGDVRAAEQQVEHWQEKARLLQQKLESSQC